MDNEKIVTLAASIVAASAANPATPPDRLPALLAEVHSALTRLLSIPVAEPVVAALVVEQPAPAPKPVPAVPVRKSVTPDYIVCLEDGKKLKMLKRHLRTAYNLTPDEYRAKWGLPADYPMVAPNYAEQRSGLAKAAGLGRRAEAAE
ncbi:MucR family transcriptional regulator [Nitrospirillum sp. BR 11752]|uniref:MucR family transcriptional regulator n=1 Tax=Nitrospirillum sp. BR 11752 TaxID=3104293 RepID=UPI002E9A7C2B|nr:MucR family transcriptional regulator [Nitrospirillum sp. BR 11752]